MKTIEITIQPNGETKVETKGFAGPECKEASRFLEEALGERNRRRTHGGVLCRGPRAGELAGGAVK